MIDDDLSDRIAVYLADLWTLSKSEAFIPYVNQLYNTKISHLPYFRCLFIGETEDGDFETGPRLGFMKKWWEVSDEGIRIVSDPKLDWNCDSPFKPFFPTPRVVFYHDGIHVATSARLGDMMLHRERGRIISNPRGVLITDIEIIMTG